MAAWAQSTLGQAGIGGALFFAALPPLDWWPLAWLAPITWILLIRRAELPGRKPYRGLDQAQRMLSRKPPTTP